jgi:hypothetical protein
MNRKHKELCLKEKMHCLVFRLTKLIKETNPLLRPDLQSPFSGLISEFLLYFIFLNKFLSEENWEEFKISECDNITISQLECI